jgi:2-polyprenyl-6-methoxyphenol hydroxylase-like FAD-dependent oxidoreductase
LVQKEFPEQNYHLGHEFQNLEQSESSVTSYFKGGTHDSADLLIGADGFRSSIRALLLPQIQPKYAGYVAWRGVVPEADLPEDILKVFARHFTFFQMPDSHILCYLIPSESGNTQAGQRRLNWVWYWNTSEKELVPLLTDAQGIRRAYAIPPGSLHPEQEHNSALSQNRFCRLVSRRCSGRQRNPSCRRLWTSRVRAWYLTGRYWLAMLPSSSVPTRHRAPRKGSRMPLR